MLTLARESLYEVFEDIQPLLAAHYFELARNREHVALDPDWAKYATIEATDSLRVFTARKDGTLVGYSVFMVAPHPHYANLVLANNDVLFLSREHRTGRTGIQLIEFSEGELAREFHDRQVAVAWHAKEATALERILKKRNYAVQDIVLSRLILPAKSQ